MDGPLSLSARALTSMCITCIICMDTCRYVYLYARMCVCVFVFMRVKWVCACMCACTMCACVMMGGCVWVGRGGGDPSEKESWKNREEKRDSERNTVYS